VTPDSRLYTFIDEPREFALYFLEGQGLIQDLALTHPIRGEGFQYFRDVVLSIQPMIALIKAGEQIGFYIDSETPDFQLKIETGHHGATRCMLLPDDFEQFPESMRGLVRVQKLNPNTPPYESIIEVDSLPLREIVNRVLRDSYQVNCAVMLSQESDQSLLLHQLPPLKKEEYDFSVDAVRARRDEIREAMSGIFACGLDEAGEIEKAFAEIGFRLLASRPVTFQCSCSRERMIDNLRPMYQEEGPGMFRSPDEILEVTCEYCKSRYDIGQSDLESAADPIN
jgi:molecular chaperone Hsp33